MARFSLCRTLDGHAAATSNYATIYFVVFFLMVVCIVTNITVAFILDSFIKIFPLLQVCIVVHCLQQDLIHLLHKLA